jgi:hypothetical protein
MVHYTQGQMNENFIREKANEGSISLETPKITVRTATLTGPPSPSQAIDRGFLDPKRPSTPPRRSPKENAVLCDSPDEDDLPEFTQKAMEQSIADQAEIAKQKKADAFNSS